MRNRYYDPMTGRFTQQDPIGLAGGLNSYGFASGDPVNFSDPFGLRDCNYRTGEGCSAEQRRLLEFEKGDHESTTPAVDPVELLADAAAPGALRVMKIVGKGVVRGAVNLAVNTARKNAVRLAWKAERELVRRTGSGTRAWTEAEIKELLETGKVAGYKGHHINNVASHPEMAGDPNNINFVRDHIGAHDGNFRNPTSGPLVNRNP